MPAIISIETSFPEHYYQQSEILNSLKIIWADQPEKCKLIDKIKNNVQVDGRHLSMPIERYFEPMSFSDRNSLFINSSLDMLEKVTNRILNNVDIDLHEIKSLWSNTVTGFAIPSLEARLMNRLNFSSEVKRVPIMGLGCMAGVAGINRVADYLRAFPKECALFLSVECCSLTFQLEDVSAANLISTSLFGDGCAAVLMAGDEHPLSKNAPLLHQKSLSVFFKDTEDVMGWKVGENGLKIILNKNVPEVVENQLRLPLLNFLKNEKISLSDFSSFFAHPGGPKVLLAMEKALDLPQFGLSHSWKSLREKGNMSSVSVLDILKRHISDYDQNNKNFKGALGLSLAMGPAFSAEIGLMKWN